MRPAPLPALLALLLAVPAAACPFGPPGHFHPSPVEAARAASPLPEGRCGGRGRRPPESPNRPSGLYDLSQHPIPADQRPYWELIGYSIDDEKHLLRREGSLVTAREIEEEERPFDASWQKLDATLWTGYMLNGYRLDEATCRLIGTDGKPLSSMQQRVWAEINRRSESHAALETLLAKLRGLDPAAPIPAGVRKYMEDLAKAGTKLPASVQAQLEKKGATVGALRGPAQSSYEASTAYFDGERKFEDVVAAALPVGTGSDAEKRRSALTDPVEKELGRALGAAYAAQLGRTPVGRELLARFTKGLPEVTVLKLTQSPNDPQAPGAVYDFPRDRMVINHWEVVRVLHEKLPPAKLKILESRMGDASKLNALLKEDPSLLPLVVEGTDVMYFHELLHAEQSRRDRMDDELLRGNLPNSNPLAKEHEAHREHCRYLFSKEPAAIARDAWRDYCLGMLRDPDAFRDEVTRRYVSTYSGSTPLADVAARQAERRRASGALASAGGPADWLKQQFKQLGFDIGDRTLADYGADVDRREKAFNAAVPAMRRSRGGALIDYYVASDKPLEALQTLSAMPLGTYPDQTARTAGLRTKTENWVSRNREASRRDERLSAITVLSSGYPSGKLPKGVLEAYGRDARSKSEEILAQALKTEPVKRRVSGPAGRIFTRYDWGERNALLDSAEAWAKSVGDKALLARIAAARPKGASPRQ